MLKNQTNGRDFCGETEMNQVVRVLIIDDDRDILKTLQQALGCLGHEVTVCENGAQAMMRATKTDFDWIITDYNVPGMDGLELTKRLRERFPLAIIIGMSRKALTEEFFAAGANDFVQKPFVPERLVTILTGDEILA